MIEKEISDKRLEVQIVAMETLAKIAKDEKAKDSDRIRACELIFDRI